MTHDQDAQLAAVQDAVLAMPMATTLGIEFVDLAPGTAEIQAPHQEAFSFVPGQLQATAIFAMADFAAVSAAGTLLAPGWVNATIDGTLKILAPAAGSHLRARGRVIHAARLLTVCAADVYTVQGEDEVLCATLLGTARNIDLSRLVG